MRCPLLHLTYIRGVRNNASSITKWDIKAPAFRRTPVRGTYGERADAVSLFVACFPSSLSFLHTIHPDNNYATVGDCVVRCYFLIWLFRARKCPPTFENAVLQFASLHTPRESFKKHCSLRLMRWKTTANVAYEWQSLLTMTYLRAICKTVVGAM